MENYCVFVREAVLLVEDNENWKRGEVVPASIYNWIVVLLSKNSKLFPRPITSKGCLGGDESKFSGERKRKSHPKV